MPNWTVKDIPPQTGKLAIVTGATGGLGYETALRLAHAGAEVVLAGRNWEKGRIAVDRIMRALPAARRTRGIEGNESQRAGCAATNKGRIISDELIHPINIDGPVCGFVVSGRLSTKGKPCRKINAPGC